MIQAWSKSTLSNLTSGCAWQVWLKKYGGLEDHGTPATARGTAFHAAVELHERSRLLAHKTGGEQGSYDGVSIDAMQTEAAVEFAEASEPFDDLTWAAHDTSRESTQAQVHDAIDNWWNAIIPAGQPGEGGTVRDRIMSLRPVAVENYDRVASPTGGRPLHGYPDAIYYDHDLGLWVNVDHKSAGNFKSWGSHKGHETEAAVYATMVETSRRYDVDPGRVVVEWHLVRNELGQNSNFQGARIIRYTINDLDRVRLDADLILADRMADDPRPENWPRNPSWNLCSPRWCAFFEGCQVSGELGPDGHLAESVRRMHLPLVS